MEKQTVKETESKKAANLKSLPKFPSVWAVFKYIVTHPVEIVVYRWNWKAAVLSGIFRGSIYFFTHITLGWRAALSAMSVEFIYRTFHAGISSSIGQAFRLAEPAWLANICIMIMLPAYAHTVEYILHTLNGDKNVNKSIVISIAFSVLSALFNVFAMRRGVLLVKDEEQKSLWSDIKRMPFIFAEFCSYPFVWVFRKIR